MKKLLSMMTTALLVVFAIAGPAYAGKKDLAWAACLWEKVPTTANNWLAMPSTKDGWQSLPTPPDYAIEWRLQAACFDVLKPTKKKWPPSFYAKSVKAALIASKPSIIGPDKLEPTGFRCDLYFENDTELKSRAGFDWGVRSANGDVVFTTTRFGFAGEGKTVVHLKEGAGIRKCFRVLADGSMTNA